MRWRLAVAAVLGLVTLATTLARAQQAAAAPSAVRLVLSQCEHVPFDAMRVGDLLRVELAALGVSSLEVGPGDALPQPLALVVVGAAPCAVGAAHVELQIVDRATSKAIERTLLISDVEWNQRPRAIAIAIVELLEASWVEAVVLQQRSTPSSLPDAVRKNLSVRLSAPPAHATPDDAETSRARHLDFFALARLFPNRSTAVVGGAVEAGFQVADLVMIDGGLEVGGGDTQVAQGTVSAYWATVDLGVDLLAGSNPSLAVGPHILSGYAWALPKASATDVEANQHDDWVLAAVMRGTLRVKLAGRCSALFSADVGHSLLGVTFLADDTRAAGLSGVTTALRLGLGIDLGTPGRARE